MDHYCHVNEIYTEMTEWLRFSRRRRFSQRKCRRPQQKNKCVLKKDFAMHFELSLKCGSHFFRTYPANWDNDFFHKIDLYQQKSRTRSERRVLTPFIVTRTSIWGIFVTLDLEFWDSRIRRQPVQILGRLHCRVRARQKEEEGNGHPLGPSGAEEKSWYQTKPVMSAIQMQQNHVFGAPRPLRACFQSSL